MSHIDLDCYWQIKLELLPRGRSNRSMSKSKKSWEEKFPLQGVSSEGVSRVPLCNLTAIPAQHHKAGWKCNVNILPDPLNQLTGRTLQPTAAVFE